MFLKRDNLTQLLWWLLQKHFFGLLNSDDDSVLTSVGNFLAYFFPLLVDFIFNFFFLLFE
jgi:hypothetical protein